MAKVVSNEGDDDKFEKMDEESLGFLEQVRKGKSRNFVLSMKGNKVRSMLIKKKPIKDKDRKEARGQGFQPVFGVASGTGANITFTVARSDGFDEKTADTKTEKLKKFLKEQTGKAFKPSFELVATPPSIPFDEEDLNDPLIARFMKMEPTINQACDARPDSVSLIETSVSMIRELLQDDETRATASPKIDELEQYLTDLLAGKAAVPPAPSLSGQGTDAPAARATEAPDADAASAFKTRLTALLPQIKAAAGTLPGDEAKLKASEAGVFARKQDYDQANALLDQAEQSLRTSSSAVPHTTPTTEANLAEEFKARLAALVPQIKAAAGTLTGDEAKLKASEAGVFARKQDYDQANTLLDKAESLLRGSGQFTAASASSDDPARAAKLAETLTKLKPLMDQVVTADPNRKGELHATMAQIAGEIKSKQFDQAKQNLVDFATLLKSLGAKISSGGRFSSGEDGMPSATSNAPRPEAGHKSSETAVPPGIVAKRSFLVTRWAKIPHDIEAQMRSFCAEVANHLPYEEPEELLSAATSYFGEMAEKMRAAINDAIDKDINAGDAKYTQARREIETQSKVPASDPLIAALNESGLLPSDGFTAAFAQALTDLNVELAK